MVGWTEKYRPKKLDDVIGNKNAKDELRQWAESWLSGIPKKRAVVLIGDPGIGKTTCAHALANELGWQVVEMNASDKRNAEAIKNVATHGAMGETFTDEGEFIDSKSGQRKLIILDEADNVFGREDYGGIRAIASTIANAQQPIILIVNDYYELKRRSSTIGTNTKTIKFSKPRKPSIKRLLQLIANAEGVEVTDAVLSVISERCQGDVYCFPPSGKLGFGCALLAAISGDPKARQAAWSVADYLASTQRDDGSWILPDVAIYEIIEDKGDPEILLDVTAEFTAFLCEIAALT